VARPAHILLCGYYGHGNAGDEIVLAGILEGIASGAAGRRYEVRAISGSPKDTLDVHGLRSWRQFSPAGVMSALAWADCLVLGGGSLIQDATSRRSALYYLWLTRMAQALGRRVFVWAQGFGPLTDPGLRRMAARVLSRASGVTVRDARSLEDLQNLGVRGAVLSADPAFLARPAEHLGEGVMPAHGGEGLLGIAVRDWPGADAGLAAVGQACAQFAGSGSLVRLYIPFQHPSDVDVSSRLAAASGPPAAVLSQRLSPGEMVRLFGELDQAVGMRLHSLVLAARAGVPFAGVSYDPKVRAFCDRAAMPCVAVEDADPENLAVILREQRGRLDEIIAGLQSFASQQKQDALIPARMFWERLSQ
jgi:polysaccharide pyruvyl transferase CsaB